MLEDFGTIEGIPNPHMDLRTILAPTKQFLDDAPADVYDKACGVNLAALQALPVLSRTRLAGEALIRIGQKVLPPPHSNRQAQPGANKLVLTCEDFTNDQGERQTWGGVQKLFMNLIHRENQERLIDKLKSDRDITGETRFKALTQTGNSGVNTVLTTLPTSSHFRLQSPAFLVILERRLGLRLSAHVNSEGIVGAHCQCGAVIDAHGDHMLSCNHYSKRSRHEAVADTYIELQAHAGLKVSKEPKKPYKDCAGFSDLIKNQIPDGMAIEPTTGTVSMMDVSIVLIAPCRDRREGPLKVKSAEKALEERAQAKIRKYGSVTTAVGASFVPIIASTMGHIHPIAQGEIKRLASLVEQKFGLPKNTMSTMWSRIFAFTIARSVAMDLSYYYVAVPEQQRMAKRRLQLRMSDFHMNESLWRKQLGRHEAYPDLLRRREV